MRRATVAGLCGLAAWLLVALLPAPAGAHEATGAWTSPAPDTPPVPAQPELAGSVTHDDPFRPVTEVTFTVTALSEQAEACPAPPALGAQRADGSTVSWRFLPGPPPEAPEPGTSYYDGFGCNGTFELVARPRMGNDFGHARLRAVKATLLVAIPAPPPTDPVAELGKEDGDRVARVAWTAPPDLPADTVGYVVERSVGEGDWVQVAAVPLGETSWTDPDPATTSGTFRYRIATVRLGASGAPDDLVASFPTEERELDVPETATATTGPDDGGDSQEPAAAPPGPRQLSTTGHVAQDLQRQAATVRSGPPTTVDNGFEQTLDYGGRRPVKAAGSQGGGTLLDVFGETDDERQDVLTPLAGALVLLMWFVLARYLLRQASKQPLPAT